MKQETRDQGRGNLALITTTHSHRDYLGTHKSDIDVFESYVLCDPVISHLAPPIKCLTASQQHHIGNHVFTHELLGNAKYFPNTHFIDLALSQQSKT